ncbi:hypothetical protein [Anabaena sp. CCY 0017]|uniref:hypothetical protein n=1 Tax=Anabaena sp. CCY 0017 TaxID=3103866 RepID=UPI0039C6E39D
MVYERVQKNSSSWNPAVPTESQENQFKPRSFVVPPQKNQNSSPPSEIQTPHTASSVFRLQQRIGAEQEKYTVGKNKFDQDSAKSRTDADAEIAKLNQDTSQQQLESQQQAQSQVTEAKLEWQTELDNADKDYQEKAGKATTDQKSKIDAEKLKADAEAAQHLADAEKEAEQKKQAAETEAQQKKDSGQKESGGFLGWVADKAAAFVDGIKQAVNFIYDKLREGIKFIFEAAKKLAIAAIELAQKAITTLIQAYGEILKGIVNLVFAAFPEIAKRITSKIDQAVNAAVQAVNTAADLLKKGVAAVLDFLANTLDSLLKLVQDIYNGIFTVIGMIIRGEFGELIKNLTNLVEAAAAAPPQFETAGLEELLGGNLDEPLSPAELAQAGIAAPGANGNAMGEGGTNAEWPQAPWTQDNVGVDAVENNMQLSPELMAELMQQTKGEGEVELGASNDASRTMEAIMSEATGGKEGEVQEGEVQEQKNPDDGLSPKQRAEVRWNLMKTGISQWWSNNWPTVLVGTTAAIGGFIALNVATGGAITAALPAIMSVVGPLFAGVTAANIGGHIRDYLAKGWAGDIPGGGKSLAKGLAAGAIELVSYLTFKAGDVALKGAKAAAKGGVKLAKGAMNLVAKGTKFIIEKGKVLFKGIAGTALGKGFKRLKELGAGLLERMRFKKFRIRVENRRFRLEGEINPWVLLATGEVIHIDEIPKEARFGDEVSTAAGTGKVISPGNELPDSLKKTIEANAKAGKKDLLSLFDVQPGKNLNLDIPSAPDGKSYITYVFKDGDNVIYVGKASYAGTPKQALAKRISRGHDHYSPDLKPEIIATHSSKSAGDGAEEFYKKAYEQLQAPLTNAQDALDMSRKSRRDKSILKMDNFIEQLAKE